MITQTGSTVPRRQLGRHLRRLRKQARITVKAASEALRWSPPKIWRIERGTTSTSAPDVAAMCRVYGASPQLTAMLVGFAKETRKDGWWHAYGEAMRDWFEAYVSLESAATRLRKYEPQLVPGLLQTEAYATEIFRLSRPGRPQAERDSAVALRLARQKAIFDREVSRQTQLDIVLDESVLRRPFLDGAGMAAQLWHMNMISRRSHVTLRVLPFSAGLYRAELANGGFTILEFGTESFEQPAEPTIVYSEGLTGALYLEKPAEVARYDEAWVSMHGACLSEAQSRELIASLAKEHAP
ncbi:helix-turn-helix transcriptional regulator [Micromonospora sp. NPDC049559]|uniref:helix-turn-helix domain-containing protein n=1 Tax=Micromonospora sp. NPDC049559 TaxID=3155923 RepID=UPI00343735C5